MVPWDGSRLVTTRRQSPDRWRGSRAQRRTPAWTPGTAPETCRRTSWGSLR
jgi:hypothetical protein